jgi:minimal PKS acyl carrier protein
MAGMTLDGLRGVMRECGVDERIDLAGDIIDEQLVDLGYDSLAVLQILTVVRRETGANLPDSMFADLKTPRDILEAVGESVSA